MLLNRSNGRATIFVEGEIDLATVPGVRAALAMCHAYDVTGIDVDLSAVPFCDASSLNVFLAPEYPEGAAADVRLHRAPPMVRRLLRITGTEFLLAEDPSAESRSYGLPLPSSGAA
ncbi:MULTISPECIES: STAS domain-containing protein [unclassified Streptomyces]|uniref:STAS domain-containing protein n=1 Tax=unclassified Streptomyces TaxID=2593676 RepID=UPI00342F8F86